MDHVEDLIVGDVVKMMLDDSSFASSVGDCTQLQNQPAEVSAEAGIAADQRLLKATAKGVMPGCASHSSACFVPYLD